MTHNGFWVGDEFHPHDRSTITAAELKSKVGIDGKRKLIALMSDGTWRLVQDHEQIESGALVDSVPEHIMGTLS